MYNTSNKGDERRTDDQLVDHAGHSSRDMMSRKLFIGRPAGVVLSDNTGTIRQTQAYRYILRCACAYV